MRFRPHGTHLTKRMLGLIAALATTVVLVVATPVAAQADVGRAHASVAESSSHSVPKVVGWTASNAAAALHSHGFGYTFKAAKHKKVSKPSQWTVTGQSPKPGAHATSGTKVVLTVIPTKVYIAQGVRSFYAQDYGTFTSREYSGSNTGTIVLPTGVAALTVKSVFSGSGAFTITELGSGGIPTGRTLVSATDSFSGYDAVGLEQPKVPTTELTVNGNGDWRITLIPIAAAPIISLPVSATGDHVYLYSGAAAMWTVSSPGPTTYILDQISSSSYPNLAVNESGNYAGRIALQPGPSVIEIHSNGPWSIH